MWPGFIVRLRPVGPWRLGPDSGARDRVDRVLHSDRLYSAVSWAMGRMGLLEEWVAAAFRGPGGPAVRFSSCFPALDELLFAPPPRNLWPPLASAKLRWKGARFVPLTLVRRLLAEDTPDEDRWIVDGLSECLLPSDRPRGPFRPSLRSNIAVDRLMGNIEAHATACVEFSDGAGMWAAAAFAGEEARLRWSEPVRAAFRLLAESGFGGRRSHGWGRCAMPDFVDGLLPDLILPPPPSPSVGEGESTPAPSESAFWLLSLFSPSPEDVVYWDRGSYSLVTRGGRVESPASWGALKKLSRMVAEGSVLLADAPVRGVAQNVAPDGFPHPVYRAGFAFAIPIRWRVAS